MSTPRNITREWIEEVPRMRAQGSPGMVRLLDSEEAMVEARSDLTHCQKNVWRRQVLDEWYTRPERVGPPPPAVGPAPPPPALAVPKPETAKP